MFQIFNAIMAVARIILLLFYGWKFFSGDKEDPKTLWYGIVCLIFLPA